ncbi:MAG: hypothetical protein OSB47_16630, partial [Pirellulaceae bacterium]|nr:hypothetical protein [Pirellulaceae bacterium]
RGKKAKRSAAQASQQPSPPPNVYVPAQTRPLNRRLITGAAILFGGWLIFLIYAAIQATH